MFDTPMSDMAFLFRKIYMGYNEKKLNPPR